MRIFFKLIGTPSIFNGSERIDVTLKKTEALLYFLATEGKATREQLSNLLWGDRTEESASNNLRNALYQLRKILSEKVIAADRRSVSLREGSYSSDLDNLDRIEDLTFKDWRNLCDEFLAGFEVPESDEFSLWLSKERTRMKETLINRLKQRLTKAYEESDLEECRRTLKAVLELDPYDEDSCLELMELYFEGGELPKALSLFSSFQAKIAEDLNIKPSSRAEHFVLKITSQKTKKANTIANIKSFFFGRERELEKVIPVISMWREVPVCVSVYGEAGIGKSSFVKQVLSLKRQEKEITLYAKGHDTIKTIPLSSWSRFMEDFSSQVDIAALGIDTVKISLLSGIFPDLLKGRRTTGTLEISHLFSEPNPITLGHILGEMLSTAFKDRHISLVLEDIQWFDEMSLSLTEGLLDKIPPRMDVYMTSRISEGKKARSLIKQHSSTGSLDLVEIPLHPFSPGETDEFCRHFIKEEDLKSLGKNSIYRDTQGIPLFLVEYIRSFDEQGKRPNKESLWGVIENRCETLSEDQKLFLEILSVFSQGAYLEEISSIISKDPLVTSKTAESLLDMGLLEESSQINGQNSLILFHHAQIKEYIYNSMPKFKKNELHKKAASLLEGYYSRQRWTPQISSQLYHHYEAAGLEEKELSLHLQEMGLHITLNHELFPLLKDEVLRSCSSPFSDRADTETRLEQVRELLHKLNVKGSSDMDLLRMEASYLELKGGYMVAWGQYREGRNIINRALRLTGERGYDDLGLLCLKHLCYHGVQTDNHKLIEPFAREMIHKSKRMNMDHYLGTALRFSGVARQLMGDFDAAERIYLRSIEVFEGLSEVGRPYTLGLLAAWNYRGELLHWQGKFDEALDYFDHCVSICEKEGFIWGLALFHSNAANVALDLGRLELMASHVDKAIDLFERCQGGRSGSMLYSLKAISDTGKGNLEQALKAIQRGEKLSAPIMKRSWMSIQLLAKACMAKEMEHNSHAKKIWGAFLTEGYKSYGEQASEMFKSLHQEERIALSRHGILR
nr:AAA family ATPase [uncultured Dethiosulfovibrio sp.]